MYVTYNNDDVCKPHLLSNHSGMKLKINYKKKTGKITNI